MMNRGQSLQADRSFGKFLLRVVDHDRCDVWWSVCRAVKSPSRARITRSIPFFVQARTLPRCAYIKQQLTMKSSNVMYRSMVMAAAAEPIVVQRHVETVGDKGDGVVMVQHASDVIPRSCGFMTREEHRGSFQPTHAASVTVGNVGAKVTVPIVVSPEAAKSTGWTSPQTPAPSVYHYMEFHHAKVDCRKIDLDALATGLRMIVGRLSLQAVYQDSPMAAHCSSHCAGQVGLTVTVLRGTNDAVGDYDDHEAEDSSCWIIEVQRRSGDSFAFSNLARQIVHQVQQLVAPKPPQDSPPPPTPRPAPVALLATRRMPSMSQAAMMERYLETVVPPEKSSQSSGDVGDSILDIISSQLKSDMFHEQRTGLECLVNATDPRKSRCHSCVNVSKALLRVDSTESTSSSVMHDVVKLALGSPEAFNNLAFSDFANEHSNLAVMALANALHVADAMDVEVFLRNSHQNGMDVLDRLSVVASGPDMGRAYHSIVALSAMCDKVPGLYTQLSHEAIRRALEVGRSAPHAALEEASCGLFEKILQHEATNSC